MASRRITGPAADPVSVEDAKCQISLTHDYDDLYIKGLIGAATAHAENYTKRAFITQTWRSILPRFSDVMYLDRPNLQSVTAVQYHNTSDVQGTLSSSVYTTETYTTPGSIRLANSQSWPAVSDRDFPVQIDYVTGYGDASTDVPADIKHAILMMIGHIYLHREATEHKDVVELPMGYKALLEPHRVHYV